MARDYADDGPGVYFAGNPTNGLVKIGYSSRPGLRLHMLSVAAGTRLELLHFVPAEAKKARILEGIAHHFAKPWRINPGHPREDACLTEWFALSRAQAGGLRLLLSMVQAASYGKDFGVLVRIRNSLRDRNGARRDAWHDLGRALTADG